MEAIYRRLVETKQRGFLTFPGTVIAAAKLEMGKTEDALNFLDELEQLGIETHQQMFLSELHRLRAEGLTHLDRNDRRIGEQYQRAVQLARRQGARMLELRAASSFAAWLARNDRPREGYKLLKPVWDLMPDRLECQDKRAARALLEQLR